MANFVRKFSISSSSCSTAASWDDATYHPLGTSDCEFASDYESTTLRAHDAAASQGTRSFEQNSRASKHSAQRLVPALTPCWLCSSANVQFDGASEIEVQMDLAYGK
eukprot:TRINITY_DN79087_c0_g1_i1.p2 TRINITY_DN79087_c0_g1~~TRINITY_DN79087_c0_g1_i1.p2  ORF type:complete len:121 (-),score=15.34 TRINITY_DN79087_c0_g1_i1:208-528(-)